jgi:hypothetical protein
MVLRDAYSDIKESNKIAIRQIENNNRENARALLWLQLKFKNHLCDMFCAFVSFLTQNLLFERSIESILIDQDQNFKIIINFDSACMFISLNFCLVNRIYHLPQYILATTGEQQEKQEDGENKCVGNPMLSERKCRR